MVPVFDIHSTCNIKNWEFENPIFNLRPHPKNWEVSPSVAWELKISNIHQVPWAANFFIFTQV